MEDAGTYRLQANNRNGSDKVNQHSLGLNSLLLNYKKKTVLSHTRKCFSYHRKLSTNNENKISFPLA